jgi:hypothetical protein
MKKTIDDKINALTALMEKMLLREVAPVAPVAPVLPVAPIAPIVEQNSGDHDAITKLVVTVGVIDTKVDHLQETMDGRLDKLEKEVEILKLWKSNLTGKLTIIVFSVSAIASGIVYWVSKHF